MFAWYIQGAEKGEQIAVIVSRRFIKLRKGRAVAQSHVIFMAADTT